MRRIGVLMGFAADDLEGRTRLTAFVQALQQLGWTDGRNVRIDTRWGGLNAGDIRKFAAELVELAPDVILTSSSAATAAMLQATRTIPIVFTIVIDPVGAGYVDNLARPGGNVTGFTIYEYSMSGKWLELLKAIAPSLTRAMVLRDPAVASGPGQFAAIQAVAPSLGVELRPVDVRDAGEIERAIAAFAQSANSGLIVTGSTGAAVHRELIITLAARHRLPAIYNSRFWTAADGLMSYGPDFLDQFRRAAGYVDRILRGEKPADLPVQAPTKYELVINLKTAKALGLDVPDKLLATRRRGDRMRRREFITLLGGAAAAGRSRRGAQQPAGKLPTIGFLGSGSASAGHPWATAFVQRLRELGWIEGRTVAIEYRWADGRIERVADIAADFVRLNVAVIVTYSNTAAGATKRAVADIPIVFAAAGDPVGTGLVASLARPGGNITGLSIQQTDLAGKRLEILRASSRSSHAGDPGHAGSPNAVLEMDEAHEAARRLGLAVIRSDVRRTGDFAPALDTLKGRAEALYLCSDPLLTTNRLVINTLAIGARLPTMHGFREFAEAGGLMSYGPNFPDLFRRAAEYVDKICAARSRPTCRSSSQPSSIWSSI